jgi:hypothetical protein
MDNVGIFYDQLEFFTAVWYILLPFGIVCVLIWYIFFRLGMSGSKKSGNPAHEVKFVMANTNSIARNADNVCLVAIYIKS